MGQNREYDLVVHGATGFVGKLVAAYLAEHAPLGVRIALSGRSRAKLEAVRRQLPPAAAEWPVVVADAGDQTALDALAASTRVVLSTVGPYAKYGTPLVQACATAGTHYADLTGETLWHRRMIDAYDKTARESGARIVLSCGFDSVPSDLGVLLLHEAVQADGAGELDAVATVATLRGGFSGGTIDSMRTQFEELGSDPSLRRAAGDWYALSPDRAAEPAVRQPSDSPAPGRRGRRGMWTAPFVMASYNTRVVRRSNALLDWAYGRGMRYGEVMGTGRGPAGAVGAVATTAGLAGLVAGLSTAPTRRALDRFLPKPGTGPSAEARANGWFRLDLEASTTSGRHYTARVAAKGDPGYAATAVMLGESGLCLALDDLPARAGCLTPATAMGRALVDRLVTAGHTYEAGPA